MINYRNILQEKNINLSIMINVNHFFKRYSYPTWESR